MRTSETIKRVRLGEVCEISRNERTCNDENVWLLNLDVIEQQTGRVLNRVVIPRCELGQSTVPFDTRCVLYSKLRPNLNKVVVPDAAGYATSELLPLVPVDGVITREYLAAFLRSDNFVQYATTKSFGAKMPRLGTKDLMAAQIPLPPLPAQRRIAAALDKISEMKRNAEARLQKLDLLVKARFNEMFERGVASMPPLRRGISSHDKYPVVTVGEVFQVGGPKRIHQSEWQDHGVPFLRISDLSERLDGNKRSAEHFISRDRYDQLKAQGQTPVAGDVLVTARGTLGRCYVVEENDEFYFQDGMITWLSHRSEKLDLPYFLNAMKSESFKRQYEGKMPGSTVAYLSIAQLAKLKLPLPPLSLQRSFAAFVEKVEALKATAQASLARVDLLYRAKLQAYFG